MAISLKVDIDLDAVRHWIEKGLAFWNLHVADGKGNKAVNRSLICLIIGVTIVAVVQMLIAVLSTSMPISNGIIGVIFFLITDGLSIFVFWVALLICLRVMALKINVNIMSSLLFYRLSGFYPIVGICSFQLRKEATKLFLERLDISLPYMRAAIGNLLFFHAATIHALIMSWTFVLIIPIVWCIYIIWGLTTLFKEAIDVNLPFIRLRIVAALLAAWSIMATAVYSVISHLTWTLMTIVSK